MILKGKVVNNKNARTISVMVEKYKLYKKYNKSQRHNRKYHAHIDDEKSVSINDMVTICSCRPISKTKKWKFVKKENI